MALTDARLAQLGKRYNELKDEESDIKIKKRKITDKVIAEFDRRNTRLLESGGVKLTKVAPEEVQYDYDALEEALGAAKAAKLRPRTVDKTALADMIASGKVDPVVVAQCTQVKQKAAYISVVIS